MSSNLRIVKICAYCKQEFIAKKTTSQTCSDACAKRIYRVKRGKRQFSEPRWKRWLSRSLKRLSQRKQCHPRQ